MGKHKDLDALAFIDELKKLGSSQGFLTETEYDLTNSGDYYADLVWILQEGQDPLIIFQVETQDSDTVYTNINKFFGTPSEDVKKPWKHFIIIYKSRLSRGHRKSLSNYINQHNIVLFENVFNDSTEQERLKLELNDLAIDLKELISRIIDLKPIDESLVLILEAISKIIQTDQINNLRIIATNDEITAQYDDIG
jgi:hypothetical protein